MIPSHGTFCLIFWWDFLCHSLEMNRNLMASSLFFSPQDCWEEERAPVCAKSVCICILNRCVWWGGLNARHWRPFCTHILCVCVCACAGAVSVTTRCKHTGAETRASPFRMRAALTSVHAVSGPIFPARTLTSKHTNISKHTWSVYMHLSAKSGCLEAITRALLVLLLLVFSCLCISRRVNVGSSGQGMLKGATVGNRRRTIGKWELSWRQLQSTNTWFPFSVLFFCPTMAHSRHSVVLGDGELIKSANTDKEYAYMCAWGACNRDEAEDAEQAGSGLFDSAAHCAWEWGETGRCVSGKTGRYWMQPPSLWH